MFCGNSFEKRHFGTVTALLSLVLVFSTGFNDLSCQSAEPDAESRLASAQSSTPKDTDRGQTGLPETAMQVGGKTYQVEVALTPKQEETGLMYRTLLPEGHGMLFPFKPARAVHFWMKNTKIPLDMLFVANGQVRHIFEDSQPCLSDPCPTYGIPEPIDMVLELPAGTARRDHLGAGDPVQIDWSALTPLPVSRKRK